VLPVLQGGQRRHLAQAVDVEGRPDAVEPVDGLGRGDRVADAQPGQARDLGEGAEDDEPRVAGEQGDAVGVVGVVAEVAVGLVEDDQRGIIPERLQEGGQRPAAEDGGGRVVGRAEDHGLGAWRDPPANVVQVHLVAGQGALPDGGSRQLDHGGVGLEGRPGHHYLVARLEGRPGDERQQLVGTVAQYHVRRGDAQSPGQGGAQGRRAAVGVEVDAGRLARDGLDHAGRGAQGVLVGRQADDVGQSEFPGDGFQGLPGLVGRDPVHDGSPESAHPRIVVSARPI